MRLQLAGGVLEAAFGGGDAVAEMDHLADGAKTPGLVGDGAHQIGLRFERGVGAAGGHARDAL